MATGYPAAIDNFTDPTPTDNLNTPAVLHTTEHTNVNDAINAIETELGTNPKGAALSVKARLDAIDAAINGKLSSSFFHAAFGVATLDAGSMLVENVDAGKITSGTIAVARIPNLSGAKINGTGSGGAAIPVDAVPSLPASQVTSGTFNAARIPSLDGTIITTGTINAARLPSSVTANANSRVVADVAARDAIPGAERVNGLLVTVLSPFTLYAWRTDNSTWNQIGGPGAISEPNLEFTEATDHLAFTNTTFGAGTANCFVAFNGPQSGQAWVGVHANFESNTAGAIVYIGFEVRNSASAGGGSQIVVPDSDKSIANGNTTRLLCGDEWLVTGLTPGQAYNARVMHLITSSNGDIFNRRVTVKPVH